MAQKTAEHPWLGLTVATSSGQSLGKVENVWLSAVDHRPDWLVLGGPGRRGRWIPVQGTTQTGDTLVTPFALDQIQTAPRPTSRRGGADPDGLAKLRQHYRLKAPRKRAAKTAGSSVESSAAPGRVAGNEPDNAMTRSEEQLRLHRSVRPREQVRLVKRVVVDEVQLPVTLRREELVLERIPISPGSVPEMEMPGELRDDPEVMGELVLYEEQPVVSKQVVPKERVRLVKTTTTQEQRVKEHVRKEKISAERKRRR